MRGFHLWRVPRFLASLQLAVAMLVSLSAVLAWGAAVETHFGRAHAKWYIYESPWFIALLSLLGLNIFSAAAIRFPWRRHQTGFVVTHLGLLVLLVGAMQSFLGGVEGSITLTEGDSTEHFVTASRLDLAEGGSTRRTNQGSPSSIEESEHVPLGFRLALRDFRREMNPGDVGNASFTSYVTVHDPASDRREDCEVAMNQPLSCNGFRIYQTGFEDGRDGRDVSRLTVTYDPGRATKYAGCLMICLGIAIMFRMRAYSLKQL